MFDFKIKDLRVCLSFYILKHMKDYQVDDSLSIEPTIFGNSPFEKW